MYFKNELTWQVTTWQPVLPHTPLKYFLLLIFTPLPYMELLGPLNN